MRKLCMQPRGFRSYATNIGIKDTTLDFTVIASDVPASAAAMFTQNLFCGPTITVGREHVADGRLQAFVINSKNANVATGEQGLANVHKITELVAGELGIAARDVLPSSTGVIGQQLPMEKIRSGIQGIAQHLQPGHLEQAACAIMTTDTYPKYHCCHIGNTVLVGIAKGVGMIEPNMATMLAYFMTDASIPAPVLRQCLHDAVSCSFNMLSVDSDTSTSDTVAIMANGLAGEVDIEAFSHALREMAIQLTKDLARDGEGASKLLEVTVEHAESFEQAKRIAKSIVNSPLVKTAIYGADPNWGRVVMAIGKCNEQSSIDPQRISIAFGDIPIYQGRPLEDSATLALIRSYLEHAEKVVITVSLGLAEARATVWGCDLTHGYVNINSRYTT